MSIEASFRPTFALIYRFVRGEMWSRFRFVLIVAAIMLIVSVALSVTLALTPPSPEHPERDEQAHSLLVNGIPFPVVVLVLYFLVPLWSARSVMKNPNFAGEFLYAFSDEGVIIRGPLSNSNLSWAAFVKARETSWSFSLYPQNAIANMVPKAGFSSETDVTAVRELIRRNIPKSSLHK
jgi:hypothetical protein